MAREKLAVGLRLLPGQGPFELTVRPAGLSSFVAVSAMSAALLPRDVERRLARIVGGPRWWCRLVRGVASAPAALGDGARTALRLVFVERRPGLLGAIF